MGKLFCLEVRIINVKIKTLLKRCVRYYKSLICVMSHAFYFNLIMSFLQRLFQMKLLEAKFLENFMSLQEILTLQWIGYSTVSDLWE